MKLGFPLRRALTASLELVRDSIDLAAYLLWLVADPSKFRRINTKKIKSLLVIYGGAIGDVYNAIGIMNCLNEKRPEIKIHFLTFEKNRKYVKNKNIKTPTLEETRLLISQRKFDALVLLQGTMYKPEIFPKKMRWDVLKIPYRVTCDNMHIALVHKQLPLFFTRRMKSVKSNGFQEQIDTFNLLGFKIKKPKFCYTEKSEKYAEQFLKKNKISKKEKLIFFHIGGKSITEAMKEDPNGCPTHLWPLDRWAIVADGLINKYNARIIFTGVGKEEDQLIKKVINKIQNKKKTINLTDKTSIEETASLLNKGDLMIATDTGTAHIAAQTKIALIDLFSSFNPRSTSTVSSRKIDIFHPEVCTSCRKYTNCPEGNNVCMKSITTQEILKAADKCLTERI